jgi:hypothetical protein
MAAAPVAVIVGLAVGAAAFAGPAAPSAGPVEPCPRAERWEADAQALADELAGASDPGGEALRQELEEAGFAPGGPAPARPDSVATLVAELLAAVFAALDTDGDGELDVTVLGPDGATPGSGPAADRSCAEPDPPG